jgi:hypothetical protein
MQPAGAADRGDARQREQRRPSPARHTNSPPISTGLPPWSIRTGTLLARQGGPAAGLGSGVAGATRDDSHDAQDKAACSAYDSAVNYTSQIVGSVGPDDRLVVGLTPAAMIRRGAEQVRQAAGSASPGLRAQLEAVAASIDALSIAVANATAMTITVGPEVAGLKANVRPVEAACAVVGYAVQHSMAP